MAAAMRGSATQYIQANHKSKKCARRCQANRSLGTAASCRPFALLTVLLAVNHLTPRVSCPHGIPAPRYTVKQPRQLQC
jgi:hypothetical protein